MSIFKNIGQKAKKVAMNAVMKKQLKNMDPAQRQMFEALLESNPELLEKMAVEAKELVKSGESEMGAMMKVGKKYQKELAEAMQNAGINPAQLQGGVGNIKGPF